MPEPERKSLLIVDDDEIVRETLAIALEQDGYRVARAGDGQTALEVLDRQPVDLLLLDILMPGMSGLEVLETVRACHRPEELPVIMITAHDHSEEVVKAFDLGASDYVTKPVDFPVLRARIRARLPALSPERSSPKTPIAPGRSVFELAPGAVIRGKYRLVSRIGHGQFGVVFAAHHLRLERPVAVKLLRLESQEGDDALQRFQQEGITLCRIQHPHAVTVFDVGVSEGGVPFLVMELLHGRTLDQEIAEGPLPLDRSAKIALAIAEVLETAHELGIIHRDVKPQNVFLHRSPDGETVKVVDFGIAQTVGEAALQEHMTLEDGLVGTPAYMAPERVGADAYDGRADIYSLGVVCYEMLAGRKPFVAEENPIRVLFDHMYQQPELVGVFRPSVPPELERLVERMLVKDYLERPYAAEVARELRAIRKRLPEPETKTTSENKT